MATIKKFDSTDGITNLDEEETVEKRRIIEQLPTINQTPTLNKFFNSTIDHFFQPKNLEKLSAYIGKRPSYWKSTKEFYKNEPSKLRNDYQLEPAMVSIDIDENITHKLFYDDLLNYIKFQGGNVTDQNRLFESEYYSWSPPIDLDKLTAFNNYFWLEDGPDTIEITEATDVENDIIGELQYTLPISGLALSSGMVVKFTNDATSGRNDINYGVEGVGRGIILIDLDADPVTFWDVEPWDTDEWSAVGTNVEGGPDYIVMERGSVDQNLWSKRNKWYHKDIIEISGTAVFDDLYEFQAKRPIIEFQRDLELYNYGRNINETTDVVYTESNDIFTELDGFRVWNPSLSLSHVDNLAWRDGTHGLASEIIDGVPTPILIDGVTLRDGMKILVTVDNNPSVNNLIYEVSNIALTGVITLTPVSSAPSVDDQVFVNYGSTYQNVVLRYSGTSWEFTQEKTDINQPILFNLYDIDTTALDDTGVYPKSTFAGNKIFGYKVNTSNTQPNDDVLGFPLTYDSYGEFVYENFVVTDRYKYNDPLIDITGLQFWRIRQTDDPANDVYSNNWNQITSTTRQFVIDEFLVSGGATTFVLSHEPEARVTGDLPTVIVELNGATLIEDTDYTVTGNVVTISSAVDGDFIVVKSFNADTRATLGELKYEIPLNLQANPTQLEVTDISNSQYFGHFREIIENQEGFDGQAFGSNNWRDTAQDKTFGRTVLQHRTPLLKTMLLSSSEDLDFMLSVRYVEREYSRFRNKFLQKIDQYNNDLNFYSKTPAEWVSQAITDINVGKTSTFAFNYSGMAGKTHIPATPSHLGVYKVYRPEAYLDETFVNPQWVIRGHDGSQYIMNSTISDSMEQTYSSDDLEDRVDQAILEYETLVYDNIYSSYKTEKEPDFNIMDLMPGYFRETTYTRDEVVAIMQPLFERWIAFKGVNYRENTTYSADNKFTWNYHNVEGNTIGNWRSLYRYYYDTDRPHTHPWEMLGFSDKPTWWEGRYGSAPYTGGNLLLWTDLENGYIHDGDRAGTDSKYARSGLSSIIPVDTSGNLKDPMEAGIFKTPPTAAQASADWKFGDGGPVENAWIKSEFYPFAIAQLGFLLKPASFVELGWDGDRQDFIFEGTATYQWVNTLTRNRPKYTELFVHGELDDSDNVYIGSGIQQWISDWIVSRGQDVKTKLGDPVRGLDVKLGHKLSGFTETSSFKATADNFGLIPQEDINITSHLSSSIEEQVYSGVLIEWDGKGWVVFGYDVLNPVFTTIPGDEIGKKVTISVGEEEVVKYPNWNTTTTYAVNTKVVYKGNVYSASEAHTSTQIFERNKWTLIGSSVGNKGIRVQEALVANRQGTTVDVPYGTRFTNQQAVYNFLIDYGRYLESKGWIFDTIDNTVNETKNWRHAGKEFLWWSLTQWDIGNFITLSPAGLSLKFKTATGAIQSVEQTIKGVYALVDKSGKKINPKETNVTRYDDQIEISPEDSTKAIYGVRLAIKEFEHVVLFNNTTIFNDLIYDVLYNLRQPRLKLNGFRTKNWTGRLDAPGFVVQDNNIYSNFEKTVDDFKNYYEVENSLENSTLREHARHALGFQPRDYLSNLIPDADSAFQFYQGLLQSKGTPDSLNKLLKIDDLSADGSFEFYEEWLFRVGMFGAVDIRPSIEIQIDKSEIRSNPQLITFPTITDDEFNINVFDNPVDDVISIYTHVPTDNNVTPTIDSRLMRKPVDNENIWPLREALADIKGDLPSAGYVKLDEIDFANPTLDTTEITALYDQAETDGTPFSLGTTLWIYDDGLGQFQVLRMTSLDATIENVAQGNPTVITLDAPVDLSPNDLIVIDGQSVSVPDLQGIHEVLLSTSNVVTLDIRTTTGKDFVTDGETGPSVYKMENVRFADITARDDSGIVWVLGDYIWVDDARTDAEVSNGDEKYWATYQYNPSDAEADIDGWVEIRRNELRVKNNNMVNAVIYNKRTNRIESYLEIYDPRKGLIPSAADNEIYYKLEFDPAKYTSGDSEIHQVDEDQSWGPTELGRLWWDLSTTKYLDYEIASDSYKTIEWGKIAPNTEIDVYEWIKSPVTPEAYSQLVEDTANEEDENKYTGEAKDFDNPAYVERVEFNPETGLNETVYYFWVKNVQFTPNVEFRKISNQSVVRIIQNPTNQGIKWFSPIGVNSVIVANASDDLIDEDTIIQFNWKIGDLDAVNHKQWEIMREGDKNSQPSDLLWRKMRDSLVGYDETELAVPDPVLTEIEKYGTLIRPRQTWYKNITEARRSFLGKLNSIMSQATVTDRTDYDLHLNDSEAEPDASTYDYSVSDLDARDALIGTISTGEFVFVEPNAATDNRWTVWEYTNLVGQTWDRTDIEEYKVNDFWSLTTWYDTNYSSSTEIAYTYADQDELDAATDLFADGDVVKILDDGTGRYNLKAYDADTTSFSVVAIENGTIEFDDLLYTYDQATNVNNLPYPHKELRIIIDTMKDDILTPLEINDLFFGMVFYVHSEQQMIDWVFKSSMLYLAGLEENVGQDPLLKIDKTDYLVEYINEAKPFHSKIRDLTQNKSFEVDSQDVHTTDFDKPVWLDSDDSTYKKLYLDVADYVKDNYRFDPDNSEFDSDQLAVLQGTQPWKDWYDDYVDNANANVRKMNITVKFDRVSCYTTVPIDGANTDSIKLLASASDPNVSKVFTLFNVTNSNIAFTKVTLSINGPELITHVGDALTSAFETPVIVTDINSLTVKKNSEVIFTDGALTSELIENEVVLTDIGNEVIFTNAPNIGDTIEIIVDETFDDPSAYISIGSTLSGTLDPETILPSPITESDSNINGVLDFDGSKEIVLDATFDYDTDIQVTFNPMTSTRGLVTITVEYTLDVAVNQFDLSTLTAADRIALKYNPANIGYEKKEVDKVNDPIRIKGITLYSSDVSDDEIFRSRFRVAPISGCEYKGTIVDGTPVDGEFDTYLKGGSDNYTVQLFDAGVDGSDTYVLNEALASPGEAKVSVDGEIQTLGTDYNIPSPYDEVVFLSGSIPALGTVIQVVVGDTFVTPPSGSSDITVDGNTFLQPHWEDDHPEEQVKVNLKSSIDMNVYFPGASGSPLIVADRFVSDGTTSTYPLLLQPQTNEGVLVYVDGVFQILDTDYTISWSTSEITFNNIPTGGAIVKISVFSHGGNTILDRLTLNGGTDTYTLSQPAPANNVVVYVDGDPVTFSVLGKTVTLDSTPSASSIVLLVSFSTNLLEQEVTTGGTDTFTMTTSPLIEGNILVSVNGTYVDFNVSGSDVVLTSTPSASDNVVINVFDSNAISLIATDNFVGTDGVAGTEANSRKFTLSRTLSDTEPKESTILVRKDGLRLYPESITYINANSGQRVYILSEEISDPETNITMWFDQTVATWGTDFVIPTTLVGNMDSSLSITQNLTDLGLTVGSLNVGDYFTITNTDSAITDFDGTWNVTVDGLPTVANFVDGGIVWTGDAFSVIQKVANAGYELHLPTTLDNGEVISFISNGDKQYYVSSSTEVTILDVDPSATYQITSMAVDTSYHIHTQVFEETIDGTYRLSQIPFNGDYIWMHREGARLSYMRDYRLVFEEEGWDTTPWNSTNWDVSNRYAVVKTNPFTGTQAEFDAKEKDVIVVTTMAGPPIVASLAYKMFRDFKSDSPFGNWSYSRISDQYKLRIRTAVTTSSTTIDLDVNSNILPSNIPSDVLYNPIDNKPGVLHVNGERIEYWSLTGPFVDGTTGRDYYTVGTLARGTGLTSIVSHAEGDLVIPAGTQQDIGTPYQLATPNTDDVPTADTAISATPNSTTYATNGSTKIFNLTITPSFATITSVYDIEGNYVDQSQYTIDNDTVTMNTAPDVGNITIVQVEPDSLNLQLINNKTTIFLKDSPGSYESQ